MDTWWWLSVPYTVVFLLFVLLFRLEHYGHPLALFFLILFLTSISSIAWMLVTIRRLILSRNMRLARTQRVKIGFVLLSVILWIVAYAIAVATPLLKRSLAGGAGGPGIE